MTNRFRRFENTNFEPPDVGCYGVLLTARKGKHTVALLMKAGKGSAFNVQL